MAAVEITTVPPLMEKNLRAVPLKVHLHIYAMKYVAITMAMANGSVYGCGHNKSFSP
jgi:hypothetical protein